MNFTLSDDQSQLRQLVERFVADRYPLADRPAHHVADVGHDAGNWALLAKLGLLALPFGEAAGGLGGGMVETMILMEGIGRGLVQEPILAEIYMAGLILEAAGPAGADAVAGILAGRGHYALAFAEPDSGFAFDRPATIAAADTLTGAKTFVLAGARPDGFVVTASDADGVLGLYLVGPDATGLTCHAYRLIDGTPAAELTLDAVPAMPLTVGAGIVAGVVDQARFAACAELLGIMETLFATTLEYLKTRRQFGVAIGSFQAIQHRMADSFATLEGARSLLYRAALVPPAERHAASLAAKSHIGEKAVLLAEDCVQLHGGMGVTDELIIGHGLKRAILLSRLFGDPDAERTRYLAAMRAA